MIARDGTAQLNIGWTLEAVTTRLAVPFVGKPDATILARAAFAERDRVTDPGSKDGGLQRRDRTAVSVLVVFNFVACRVQQALLSQRIAALEGDSRISY